MNPSYKRSVMSSSTFREWILQADHPEEIEWIVALDAEDSSAADYATAYSTVENLIKKIARFEINVGPSTNANQAMNRVAKLFTSTTELLISVSDDFGCPPHWDTELFKLLEGVDNFRNPKYIWPDDGYWSYGTICVFYFVNRAFYERLGHVVSDEYTSMFSDNELMEVAHLLNAVIQAPQIKFQHKHYSHGHVPFDETYARRNNQQEFNSSMEIFLRRKARNFDLKLD